MSTKKISKEEYNNKLKRISDAAENSSKVYSRTISEALGVDVGDKIKEIKKYLLGNLIILNYLDVRSYLGKHGKIKTKIDPFRFDFKSESILWRATHEYPMGKPAKMDSSVFRGRFVTSLVAWYVTRLDEILSEYIKSGIPMTKKKILSACLDNIIQLVTTMLIGDDYSSSAAVIVYQMLAYEINDSKSVEYAKAMKKLSKKDWNDPKFAKKSANQIYRLVTGDKSDLSVKMRTDGAKLSKSERIAYVKLIGDAITDWAKKHDASMLYKIWKNSNPYIRTRKGFDIKDVRIERGCQALAFWAFISNDKEVTKFVNQFIVI